MGIRPKWKRQSKKTVRRNKWSIQMITIIQLIAIILPHLHFSKLVEQECFWVLEISLSESLRTLRCRPPSYSPTQNQVFLFEEESKSHSIWSLEFMLEDYHAPSMFSNFTWLTIDLNHSYHTSSYYACRGFEGEGSAWSHNQDAAGSCGKCQATVSLYAKASPHL